MAKRIQWCRNVTCSLPCHMCINNTTAANSRISDCMIPEISTQYIKSFSLICDTKLLHLPISDGVMNLISTSPPISPKSNGWINCHRIPNTREISACRILSHSNYSNRPIGSDACFRRTKGFLCISFLRQFVDLLAHYLQTKDELAAVLLRGTTG